MIICIVCNYTVNGEQYNTTIDYYRNGRFARSHITSKEELIHCKATQSFKKIAVITRITASREQQTGQPKGNTEDPKPSSNTNPHVPSKYKYDKGHVDAEE